MLNLFLKWLAVALIVLCLFSIATSLFAWYQLNLGGCREGCEAAQSYYALMHVGLIGLAGFGVSAFTAIHIRRYFERDNDRNRR
jgi:hypothetical protein